MRRHEAKPRRDRIGELRFVGETAVRGRDRGQQQQLLAVADGYRTRGYPLDVMVLDWFYWTRMGQLDIDHTAFPDPQAMNQQLHAQGVHSIISVWPRFERESRYFDFLAANRRKAMVSS